MVGQQARPQQATGCSRQQQRHISALSPHNTLRPAPTTLPAALLSLPLLSRLTLRNKRSLPMV